METINFQYQFLRKLAHFKKGKLQINFNYKK